MNNYFVKIKDFYNKGLWTEAMVNNAVVKNVITQEQANEILGVIEEPIEEVVEPEVVEEETVEPVVE